MPIYEYRCEQGHTFEVVQRIADDPVMSCTTCSAPVQRVFHPIAVHFKGSGFYNTDYGTRNRAREKEGAEGKSDGSASTESKTPDTGSSGGETSKSDSKQSDSKQSEPKRSDQKPSGDSSKAKSPASS